MRYSTGPAASFSFGPPLTPMVRTLLSLNIAVFVIQFLLGSSSIGIWFETTFGLVPAKALGALHLWQPLTYMFLHVNFMHILMNMFVLWMFGSALEQLWGGREFLRYYLIAGVGAGLLYMLVMPLIDAGTRHHVLMGASGGVYALLAAYALIYPDRKLYFWLLIPVPAKYLALGIVVLETLAMWNADNVAHLAHLGGMAIGYLYLRGGRRMLDNALKQRRKKKASSRFRVVEEQEGRGGNGASGGGDEVDRILEKISREGLDSLSDREREILRRASRH